MSKPVERLADLAEFHGMTDYATDLREAIRKNRQRGGLEEFPQLAWQRQIDEFVIRHFHTALGQTEKNYRQSFFLPEDVAQPVSYKGLFDILIPVEPRIPLERQLKLAFIAGGDIYEMDLVTNTTPLPDKPYAIWVSDRLRYTSCSVDGAISQFRDNEVGSPLIEVVALYLQHPELFKDCGVFAAGSGYYGDDRIPFFSDFSDRVPLVGILPNRSSNFFSVLSRGKETIPLGVSNLL